MLTNSNIGNTMRMNWKKPEFSNLMIQYAEIQSKSEEVALVRGGVGKGSAAGTLASSGLKEASIVAESKNLGKFVLLLWKEVQWITELEQNLKEREGLVVGRWHNLEIPVDFIFRALCVYLYNSSVPFLWTDANEVPSFLEYFQYVLSPYLN